MNNLTNSERKILVFLAEGLNNKEISKQVFCSVSTVKSHLENIYFKLNVKNRVQAAVLFTKMEQSR